MFSRWVFSTVIKSAFSYTSVQQRIKKGRILFYAFPVQIVIKLHYLTYILRNDPLHEKIFHCSGLIFSYIYVGQL